MRVIVTGSSGFIGSALVAYLTMQGHNVMGIDKKPPRITTGYSLQADISGDGWFESAQRFQPNAICHLAASFANERSVDHPEWDCQDNVLGTVQVARLAKHLKVPVIYTGSSSSYGAMGDRPFRETDVVSPSTPYALSKHVGEDYLKTLKVPGVIFRLFNVFGPGDHPGHYRNAIPNMAWLAKTEGRLKLYGEDSTRDFTPIHVVLKYIEAALKKPHLWPEMGVYNLCVGREVPMVAIADRIADWFKAHVEVHPRREWDTVPRRCGDPSKLYSRFGRIEVSDEEFQDAFTRTLLWLEQADVE